MAAVLTLLFGGCGRDAVNTASRPADSPAASAAVGEVVPPAGPPLVDDAASLPAARFPTEEMRFRGWWSPMDAGERFLAVNRIPSDAGLPGAETLEEHHLVDLTTHRRRLVLPRCVSGDGWWSMTRAISDEGWTVWEEVEGQAEARWRLYGASFDRDALSLGEHRVLLEGKTAELDRCHFAVFGRRLIATTNSYDGDTSWRSRGWLFAVDIETGEQEVVYRAPVSVGDLCVASDGTAALVEYTDPDDVTSARLVVVRLRDGAVLLRQRYEGGPVRSVAWDGRTLAWEAERDDDEGCGCFILMRTHGGVVHHIHEHGIAPALAGGRLFVTDLMGADGGGVTFAVRVDDLAAVRLPGRGNVAPSTTSLRRAVVTWHSGEDTVVRKTSVR